MKTICTLLLMLFVQGILNAQLYQPLDAASKVTFVIKNMGMDVEGSLSGLKGAIIISKNAISSFDVTAAVTTVNTGIEKRDRHLQQPDFFDASKYPVIQIKSKKILPKSGNVFYAEAVLTMHGISKDIQFDFVVKPTDEGYQLTGNFSLNRLDYKVGSSSMTLGDKVNVRLSVIAKK